MNTPAAHSFVRLVPAMRALAAWLDAPATVAGRKPGGSGDAAATLRRLCADGLRCLADNADEYDRLIARPNAFAAHFAATVAMLAPAAASFAATGAHPDDGSAPAPSAAMLDDATFMLVEDMAALFRERSLRAPEDAPRHAEEALLAHFEHGGEWVPADGTTVTDWYYVRLPALVLAQLLRRAESAARAAGPCGVQPPRR
ncbi:hypothetical protein DA2_1229 [Desulfovibrio sp. A2]|nr:hypothetical protein DA2_1229 [Desulfovibrio sp. A2]